MEQKKQRLSPFWRHYWQMAGVMAVGMLAAGTIVMVTTHAKTWEEATILFPNRALLLMAVGMSVPMAAFMLRKGMGWKNSYEMAAAMALPVIPFFCLVWFNVTKSAQCGLYCLLSFFVMYGLMRYRRSEYSMPMHH